MSGISGTFLAAFTALLTVAVVAVLMGQHAQTAAVLQALGNATAQGIGAAVAPVTQAKAAGS